MLHAASITTLRAGSLAGQAGKEGFQRIVIGGQRDARFRAARAVVDLNHPDDVNFDFRHGRWPYA